jgi:hypothetical protein
MNEPQCDWCDGDCTCNEPLPVTNGDIKRVLESPQYLRALSALMAPTPSLWLWRKP